MDGSDVMLAHYCAMLNQPRMVLVPGGDANKLVFKFEDATNIEPDAGHMKQVVFIVDGPNHPIEELSYQPEPPPYPLGDKRAADLFDKQFQLVRNEAVSESVPMFAGAERWQEWRRHDEAP